MRIKSEYKGKTIVKSTTIGNITVVIDNIDIKRYQYMCPLDSDISLRRNRK